MYKVVMLPSAKQDIKEAATWYNKIQSDLGLSFTKEIKQKTYLLKKNPFGYSVRYRDVRVSSINRFPFLIHFKIEENIKTLLMTAVFHTSRNPEIWDKR